MSNAYGHIGLDLQLQQHKRQLGHGNSDHNATIIIPNIHYGSSSSTSSSTKRSSKSAKHVEYGDVSKRNTNTSNLLSKTLIRHEYNDEISGSSSSNQGTAMDFQSNESPFNGDWICSQDFVQNRTPSRKDNIKYQNEMLLRRRGTNFIRQVANHLKLKPICKETATIYFHRFYMLRSLKQYEPYRIGMACLYLACKFEDHPTFKEHLVRISYMSIHRKDLNKADKEYVEWCDRLICDENLLLQVLGFNLQIQHFQVVIVQSCSGQKLIEGTTKDLYTTAYKISSEINRLTMLCVEYPSPILACIAIYLASVFQGITLPDGWCAHVKGATCHDAELVVRTGEEHKELLANDSDLVKSILKESGVKCSPSPYASSGDSSRGSTPSHSAFFSKSDHLSQQILTTFSPDSAYSSNSSHSPPENSNFGNQRHTQAFPIYYNGHSNHMMNYPQLNPVANSVKSKHQQQLPYATYSPTATNNNNSGTSCYTFEFADSKRNNNTSNRRSGSITLKNIESQSSNNAGYQHQSNNNTHTTLANSSRNNKKRSLVSNNHSMNNSHHSANRSNMNESSINDGHRKRVKNEYQEKIVNNNSGNRITSQQLTSGKVYENKIAAISSDGHRTSNNNSDALQVAMNTGYHSRPMGSFQYHSMPHF
ncbi:hypothetical protein RDWZM_001575 [Blomia tropicalis]|uniref:Cyclin-like domain-containing protein n=1 Tax=Blomia tropicalis TaxID=40697 RepID=A0A9Q0RQV4_BLOTA|nr:hypothetical protein RDWZM_001575 [Blomia tropicalis]